MSYLERAVAMEVPQSDCQSVHEDMKSRVLFGIGFAHQVLPKFSKHVRVGGFCLERLFDWKDTRANEFYKDIPTRRMLWLHYVV